MNSVDQYFKESYQRSLKRVGDWFNLSGQWYNIIEYGGEVYLNGEKI